MRTSWEKLVQHVGTKYSQDIRNELNSKLKGNLVTPVHTTEFLLRHTTHEEMVRTVQSNVQAALRAYASMIRTTATSDPSDAELPMNLAILDHKITKGDYDLANEIPIDMSKSENTVYGIEWHTYRRQNTNL